MLILKHCAWDLKSCLPRTTTGSFRGQRDLRLSRALGISAGKNVLLVMKVGMVRRLSEGVDDVPQKYRSPRCAVGRVARSDGMLGLGFVNVSLSVILKGR